MKVRLTETAIASATRKAAETGKRLELADSFLPGLRLRLTPTGGRGWILGMRDAKGKPRRFQLGEYPALGIADAREKAKDLRNDVKDGVDPIQDARKRKAEAEAEAGKEGIATLNDLLELYGRKDGASLKSWAECDRRIRSVFGKLITRPLVHLTIGDLQMAADNWESGQSAAAAVRFIRPILKWASVPGRVYVPRSLADLVPPATVAKRTRTLTRDELAKLLPVLRTGRTPYHHAALFLLYTLARRQEAGSATWGDVDFAAGTWTIPVTKNGQPHAVPLPQQAIELLLSIRPIDVRPTALIFATSNGTGLSNWDKATKAIMRVSGTSGWTRHDLRRTGATMLGEMGEMPDIIEAALNHASIHSSLAATYNRSRYRPQVAMALQRLADALDGIGQGGAEIVPLRARG